MLTYPLGTVSLIRLFSCAGGCLPTRPWVERRPTRLIVSGSQPRVLPISASGSGRFSPLWDAFLMPSRRATSPTERNRQSSLPPVAAEIPSASPAMPAALANPPAVMRLPDSAPQSAVSPNISERRVTGNKETFVRSSRGGDKACGRLDFCVDHKFPIASSTLEQVVCDSCK